MSKNLKQFDLETIEVSMLPELQGWKEKQEAIVNENPFVSIVDNKTYEEAKKARTTLVSARTTIEKQDKLIASKLKDVRTKAGKFSEELINITLPHEEKQQEEIKRYEAIKEAERLAKEKAEKERKDAIEKSIETIYQTEKSKIDNLTFAGIDVLKKDFEDNLYKTDVTEFEEFELQFASKLQLIKQQLEDKIVVLNDKEEIRLEKVRLEEIRLENERKENLEKQRQSEITELSAFVIDASIQKFMLDNGDLKNMSDDNFTKLKSMLSELKSAFDKSQAKIEEDRLEIKKEKEEIKVEKQSIEKSAFQLKVDTRIKQLTDVGLTFDLQSTYTGFNFFVDILDIKTYDDDKWSELIQKIDEVKSTPVVETPSTNEVAEIEVTPAVEVVEENKEQEVEKTTSEEVQKAFKKLASLDLFLCDYINGRACLKNSNDEIVFSFKLQPGLETLISLKMALNQFSTLKNQIFN